MNEPFGPQFYEWWAGLTKFGRYAVGAAILLVGGVMSYISPGSVWFAGGPLAGIGVWLIMLAGWWSDD